MTKSDDISKILNQHYDHKLTQHGDLASAMDWRDQNEQYLRFRSFLRAMDAPVFLSSASMNAQSQSILDVGCGTGHFYEYLKSIGVDSRYVYAGTDISLKMISLARAKHPSQEFFVSDFATDSLAKKYDHVFTNGILTLKTPEVAESEFWKFAERLIDQMWASCKVSIAFNMITKNVDREMATLFHVDPARMISFCEERYKGRVSLYHDYNLYEFIVVISRTESAS